MAWADCGTSRSFPFFVLDPFPVSSNFGVLYLLMSYIYIITYWSGLWWALNRVHNSISKSLHTRWHSSHTLLMLGLSCYFDHFLEVVEGNSLLRSYEYLCNLFRVCYVYSHLPYPIVIKPPTRIIPQNLAKLEMGLGQKRERNARFHSQPKPQCSITHLYFNHN